MLIAIIITLCIWCLILTCVTRAQADEISNLKLRSEKCLELWRGQMKFDGELEKSLTRVEERVGL